MEGRHSDAGFEAKGPEMECKGEGMKIRTNFLMVGRATAILAVATLLISIQGASAATTDNQVINEQLLGKNVRHALVMIPWYGVFDNLEYTMNGNQVVLSGEVVQPV